MIKYSIPGMYEHKNLNFFILALKKEHPECFYDNVEIEAVYGNPQFCIWDGGRTFSDYSQTNYEELEEIINTYNYYYEVPIRYVFTGQILEEKHYYNRFGNILMEIGNNYKNQVVLANDDFRNYLSNNYKNYDFISSTTKCILNKEDVKKELNNSNYKLVCLDYNLNKNIEFLKTFTEEEKQKTELLINAICPPGCPHRKNHYYLNSLSHLNYGKRYIMEDCYIKGSTFDINNNTHHLKYEDLVEIYEPLGFSHFKIEGRTWDDLDLLLTYCNYLIKPEWKNFVISEYFFGED